MIININFADRVSESFAGSSFSNVMIYWNVQTNAVCLSLQTNAVVVWIVTETQHRI